MENQYWLEKWRTKDILFHRAETHPFLVQAFQGLRPGRILIPLCGKSLDMKWLLEKGHQVVGVELSEIACAEFFSENEIPCLTRTEVGFKVFAGKNVELWCGDFFAFKETGFDSYYDRAALVALPPATRQRYVAHLGALLTKKAPSDFKGLVITFEYPQERVKGPPFAVLSQEVDALYHPYFEVSPFLRKADLDLSRNPRFAGIPDVAESAYTLGVRASMDR